LAWLAFEWARPLGLAALFSVPVVWWLASRSARPPRVSTGTLEVWREVTRTQPSEIETRRATSLALWCLLASLACGALALAGPREVGASSAVTWRVVVDRSPSMYLPIDGAGGATRLARALATAREQLAAVMRDGDDVEWVAADGSFSSLNHSAAPPQDWLTAPAFPHAAPRFELFDRPGVLFVTDAPPQPEPRHAGWCASGGDAVGGVVACTHSLDFSWAPGQASEPAVAAVDDSRWFARWPAFENAAPSLRSVFEAWSAARSVERIEARSGSAATSARIGLELSSPLDGELVDVRAGRDGWSLRGKARAVRARPDEPSESWLSARRADGSLIDVVRWRPGRIEIGLGDVSAPEGDSAAFAVSWAKLFDGAMLPPAEVIAIDERQAAGRASSRAPRRPEASGAPGERPYDAWLALAAAACAVLALTLRR
jgi:hypothetical protein